MDFPMDFPMARPGPPGPSGPPDGLLVEFTGFTITGFRPWPYLQGPMVFWWWFNGDFIVISW